MNTQFHSCWGIITLIYTIPYMKKPVETMALKKEKYNNKHINENKSLQNETLKTYDLLQKSPYRLLP